MRDFSAAPSSNMTALPTNTRTDLPCIAVLRQSRSGMLLTVLVWATITISTAQAQRPARIALEDRVEFQEALQASSQDWHEVAAVKLERLLKDKTLSKKEATSVAVRMVDACLRAQLPDKALAALSLSEVPNADYWRAQALVLQGKYRNAELALKAHLREGGDYEDEAKLTLAQVIIGQERENAGRQLLKEVMESSDAKLAARGRLLWNESEIMAGRASLVLRRLSSEKDSPESEFLKGCCYLSLGEAKRAEGVFKRMDIPQGTNRAKALQDASEVRAVEAYAMQGREPAALRRLMGEEMLGSDVSSYYYEQSFALLDRMRSMEDEDALDDLRQWAATPAPAGRQALALYYLALRDMDAGRGEAALRSLATFREKFPQHRRTNDVLRLLMTQHGLMRQDEKVLELAKEWRQLFGLGGEDTVDFLTGMVRFARGEHTDAAHLFRQSASVASDILQRQRALYNAAVAAFVGGDEQLYAQCLTELKEVSSSLPEPAPNAKPQVDQAALLQLETALDKAARRDADAVAELSEFVKAHPSHPRTADALIAQAEFLITELPPQARAALTALEAAAKAPQLSEATKERLEYTRLWLKAVEEDLPGVVTEGLAFLEKWPQSSRRDAVRMKVAQSYYRMEDFAKAQSQFETLEEEKSDSPFAEAALFFAGKSAMQLGTDGSEKALSIWADVVARKGPLMTEALRQQALVKRRKGGSEDLIEALTVIENLLTSKPAPEGETKLSLLLEKGELQMLLSRSDPKRVHDAVSIFESVARNAALPRLWRVRAAVWLSQSNIQLGRNSEALEACTDAVTLCLSTANATPLTPSEQQWFYRAGFAALDQLEARQQWEAAAKLAERLSSGGGTRAEEARQRATKLRTDHFLWEK